MALDAFPTQTVKTVRAIASVAQEISRRRERSLALSNTKTFARLKLVVTWENSPLCDYIIRCCFFSSRNEFVFELSRFSHHHKPRSRARAHGLRQLNIIKRNSNDFGHCKWAAARQLFRLSDRRAFPPPLGHSNARKNIAVRDSLSIVKSKKSARLTIFLQIFNSLKTVDAERCLFLDGTVSRLFREFLKQQSRKSRKDS